MRLFGILLVSASTLLCAADFLDPFYSPPYIGQLQYVTGDIKKVLSCWEPGCEKYYDDAAGIDCANYINNKTNITCPNRCKYRGWKDPKKCINKDNYKMIIDSLRNKLHCNTIRIAINAEISDVDDYPETYDLVIKYAREQHMYIFANPLGTGYWNKTWDAYAVWISDFAVHFKPHFLGPFNEAGLPSIDTYVSVTKHVEDLLAAQNEYTDYQIIGPSLQKIQSTINAINKNDEIVPTYDIIASNTAANDTLATAEKWAELAGLSQGKQVWNTECPCGWDNTSQAKEVYPVTCDTFCGVRTAAEANLPVQGVVIYHAYPQCVNKKGKLTKKGKGIANGILNKTAADDAPETKYLDTPALMASGSGSALPAFACAALAGVAFLMVVRRARSQLVGGDQETSLLVKEAEEDPEEDEEMIS